MSGVRKKRGGKFTDSGSRVVLSRVDPEAMFLRQEIVAGSGDGRAFSVTVTTGGTVLVELEGPRAVYAIVLADLVEAALDAEAQP